MPSERFVLPVLVCVLLAAGAAGWGMAFQPNFSESATALASLPPELGGFKGEELPIESAVESMLRADFNLQRAYQHSLGDLVWLYVGYYGTKRGGTPEHTPDVCYWANGWEVVHDETVTLPGIEGARAREFVVEQGGHQRFVLFWYRSYRAEGIPSTPWLHWDHFAGRLSTGRADGALIRLSTPMPDRDIEVARARTRRFAAVLAPEIASRWPSTTAAD